MTTAAEKKPDAKPEAHNINISLPQHIYDKIVELAKADDRTPASWLRRYLKARYELDGLADTE